MEVKVFHSSMGNNQFVLYPLRIAPTPVCEFMKNEYKTYLADDLSTTSDFPQEDSDLCPLKKAS